MKVFICPYCNSEINEEFNECCGEAGHGEWVDYQEYDPEGYAEYLADQKMDLIRDLEQEKEEGE